MHALSGESTARLAAPFVAVAPTAIWVGVSADGYFAGVAAWGIALLAVAVHRAVRFPALLSAGAGLLLGWSVFLSYGLMLLGLVQILFFLAVGKFLFHVNLGANVPGVTLTLLMLTATRAIV